jgi:SSS family solute:Na+ symporter
MPAGFRGLVLAGLLATVLSTLDSYVFTASTTLVYDLGPRRLQKSLKAHHWGILVTGILAVGFSGYFEGNIKEIWKALGSFSAAALLLPILVGHFFPGRLNDSGFTMAALAAILATLTWRNLELSTPWSYFDPIYAGFTASLWVIIAFVAKNHLWRDSDPKGLRSK